ncbi:MAG: hypothetical protein GY827_08425 [Cytophagales bacterium]|nr:hypothetical protein [Cytophagales bacterium]
MKQVKSPFILTPLLNANLRCTKDVIVHQGGTSSGKTWANVETMIIKAIQEPRSRNLIIGQDIPNLKSGSIADLENVLYNIKENIPNEYAHIFKSDYHGTDKIHTFFNNSYIKFMSYDDAQDAKNGKNDNSFFNEANGIIFDIYDARAVRTERQVIVDFNADAPFWAHEKLIGDHCQWFFSNYTHNPFLSEKIRQKIERRRDNKDWWRVYGLGLTGQSEGIIFRNVKWLKKGTHIPKDCTNISYGIDFGYSNDPTTIVKTGEENGYLYIELIAYSTGLYNKDIAQILISAEVERGADIFADHDPQNIAEINKELKNRNYYVKVKKALKGQDSIRFGIQLLQAQQMLIVEHPEFIKEQMHYKWHKTKVDSKGHKKPIDSYNHIWDAVRYARATKVRQKKQKLLGFARGG